MIIRLLTAFLASGLLTPAYGVGLPGGMREPTFVAEVGGIGTFLHPYGIKVRGAEVFVADTGGDQIDVFNKTTGTLLRTIEYGTTPGATGTSHPYQLDFDSSGNLWVMDNNAGSCRIYKLNPTTGAELDYLGGCGAGDGQFTDGVYIRGLVIHNDEIYVSDAFANRIQVFDTSGNFVRKFSTYGPPAQSAYHLAIYNNEIYVAESLYVQVYDLNGVFSRTLSIPGQSISGIHKIGIVNGELWASDTLTSQIHIIDPSNGLEKRRPFGVDAMGYCVNSVTAGVDSKCLVPGQFNNPGEIAYDGGYLYIADTNNYRYQKFSYPFTADEYAGIDDVPSAFTFVDQTDVALSSTITSAAITVSGINKASAISVSGGTYDKNSSGTFTASAGTVSNGDTVRAQHTSSASAGTAVNTVVSIGGVSDTFTSTTIGSYTDCSYLGSHAFAWFGDYSGDTDKACKSGGTLDGTLSGASIVASGTDPGVSSPSSGGNVLKATANGQYLRFAVTNKDIFDSAEGLLQIDVDLASSVGVNYVFNAAVNASNKLQISINANGTISVNHVGNGSNVYLTSTDTVPDTTWTRVYVRWSVTNNQIGIKIGSGSWKTDSDADAVTAFASEPTTINFLNSAIADPTYMDNIYLNKASGL